MIVVEGPDGAGKTTLVEAITEEFGLHVGTRGTTDRDLLYTVTVPDTMRALACMVQGIHEPMVWDRLYYSDFVYAPVQGRDVAFSRSQQHHIEDVIDAVAPPVILCLPPKEVVLENAARVHQMDGVDDNIATIYDEYEVMWERGRLGLAHLYDYTIHTLDPVFGIIRSYISQREDRS